MEKRAPMPVDRLAAFAVIRRAADALGRTLDFQAFSGQDSPREKEMGLGNCGTILVVDHDGATRAAATYVAVRLGYEVRSAENADLVVERLGEERPALAIVEVELPGPTSGLELLRELHAAYGEDLPVILVSAERQAPLDHVTGLMLGADDYVAKPFDRGELLARVRRSLRRAGAPASNGNGHGDGAKNGDHALSPREREILALLADGKSQTQIAAALVISPKTVATHIQHVLSKLGVHSRAQAVAIAYRLGLVEPDVRAHSLELLLTSD
jgi:DNA-binding NarL/FixJ family response regulator